jgi:diguanylate cyclase (GGDEF)-like protein/PAS domain S-box-containing protein
MSTSTASETACDLPTSVQLADQMVDLVEFLEDVSVGFHWDILDRLEDGVYLLDKHRRIRYWSDGCARITGYAAQEVLGHCCGDNILNHVNERGECMCRDACPISVVLATGEPQAAEVFLHHKAGHRVPVRVYGAPIRDRSGEVIGAFETFSETTALLGPLERVRQLERVAFLDPLTGIANRRYMEYEIDRRIHELRRDNWPFGVVMADVDHFKVFNDNYGHETGDRVLQMITQTLKRHCRPYDLVGRWGGEEFLTVVSLREPRELSSFAERASALVAASTLDVEGEALQVTISSGGVLARHNDDVQSLVRRADELLYQSKARGRNRVTVQTV